MSKRFTDTNKWKDTWFQDLPNKYKLFWIYLLDECDAAGLWKPNMRLAHFQVGEPFEESELKRVFADRIQITDEGYWFIPKFIDFQYGELSDKSKPHLSVLRLLEKHKIKGYPKGIHTLKEKEKDKDKEEDNDIAENLILWGNQIIAENDPIWEQMKGHKINAQELDQFISVAVRNDWNLSTQQQFRYALKGFKTNEKPKEPKNKYKLQ